MSEKWYSWTVREKDFLHNKILYNKEFPCLDGTHEHCEICWACFSKYAGDLKSGYYEPDSKSWICEECCQELQKHFGWIVE